MKCDKCGTEFDVGDQYCQICGNERNVKIVADKKDDTNIGAKIVRYVGLIAFAFAFISFFRALFGSITITNTSSSESSSKLVCNSYDNMITIFYKNGNLDKYLSYNYDIDFDSEKKNAKKLGIDSYINDFQDKYSSNYNSSCVIYDSVYQEYYESNNSMEVVGDNEFGYLYIPANLNKDELSSKYYSDSITVEYGVLKEYNEESLFNAAGDFLNIVRESNKYDEIKASHTDIGKDSEYPSYEVYMYDNVNGRIIVYYFFIGKSNYVEFISLDCKKDMIDEYLFIPGSYDIIVS